MTAVEKLNKNIEALREALGERVADAVSDEFHDIARAITDLEEEHAMLADFAEEVYQVPAEAVVGKYEICINFGGWKRSMDIEAMAVEVRGIIKTNAAKREA